MTDTSNDQPDDTLCPYCESPALHTFQRLVEFHQARARGSFYDELTKCGNCGEEFYTYEQSLASSAAHAAAVAEAQGSPSPARIRAIRGALNSESLRNAVVAERQTQ